MDEQDIIDAIDLMYAKVQENGYSMGSHVAKGSGIRRLQNAIRHLTDFLRDHPEQFDDCNYTFEEVRTS